MLTTLQISLLEFLDLSQLNCLNETPDHTFKSIVSLKTRNSSSNYLLSDVDEQLLLNISFNQTVRVRSIVIHSSVESQAPRTIKILVNRPNLGFEDVEDAEEPEVTQVLSISDAIVTEGKPILLRFVRFQAVNSLHIFISSNHGNVDETRIDGLDILGNLVGCVIMTFESA
ncbi:DUF1000-domain-containing protein [Tricholoma matsutake]|nr:DUF1000-domain-containing protein [Tricholoma matsutake 945]